MTREQRWRLLLGKQSDPQENTRLDAQAQGMDQTLEALYEADQADNKQGGMGGSSPKLNRWLGDIRRYFSKSVVQIMQKDALERLNIKQMLLQPEILETLQVDVHLAATLLSLNKAMPQQTRETARMVVRKVVDELMQKLREPLQKAVLGALSRSERNYRPRHNEIDWKTTIRYNLRHYQAEYQTIIPQRLVGNTRRGKQLREVVLCIDQSGSMASSVVYSGIFAAVLASLPALRTRLVVFDTAVVDLSDSLNDPVELLFGTQLGGGTDIHQALTYCHKRIERPERTILVLVSDLYEGGDQAALLRRAEALLADGVRLIALLALTDQGSAGYDKQQAERFRTLGIPTFACTPDRFPDLMSAALQGLDLSIFTSNN